MSVLTHLIGLDWGTSRLRAYLIDSHGTIVEQRMRPWGIRHLPEGGFEAALSDITQQWPDCPRLAAGMIGSRDGWVEARYLDLPLDITRIGDGLARISTASGQPVHVVPGLRDPSGPDVMRGEETQILGALSLRPQLKANSIVVLPGTHSKWTRVHDGLITRFRTSMTGELYALLSQQSTLAVNMAADVKVSERPETRRAFERGVCAARDSGVAGALSRLFSTRALLLDGQLEPLEVPDYLSGLLIGEEVRAALAGGLFEPSVVIQLVGEPALCERYRTAAHLFDLNLTTVAIEDAAAKGLWQVACAAGLIKSTMTGTY